MKQWMKKIGALLFAGSLTACLLAGCAKEVVLDVDKLAEELRNTVAFTDDITKIDDSGMSMLYKELDTSKVEKSAVYTSSGASTEEIGVFEAKTKDDVQAVKDAVQKRIDAQIEGYSDYGPDQVPRLNDVVLETAGKYVIFVASDHNDQAKTVIEKYTK